MSIIYTDQIIGANNGGIINNTPGAAYAGVNDFATILDNIASGEIPSGTGEPFPVNWNESPDNEPPWFPDGPNPSNPWKNY